MDINLIGGMSLAAVLAFLAGYFIRSRIGHSRLTSAERQARGVIDQAEREAESVKRSAVLEGREEALRHKQQVERESQAARTAQLAAERAFQEKEAAFNRRVELIEKKDRDLKRLEQDVAKREEAVTGRNRELDGLLQESENIGDLDSTDVADLNVEHSDVVEEVIVETSPAEASIDDTNVGEGELTRELGPDENTQRRLERVLDESFIERRASQTRRSGNT